MHEGMAQVKQSIRIADAMTAQELLDGSWPNPAIRHFRRAWRTACKAAGQPHLIPHDLRRSAVRNLERAGVSRSVAMKLVGHKTEAIYRRYAIVSEADLREGTSKLSALYATEEAAAPTVVPLAAAQAGRSSKVVAKSKVKRP